MIRRRLLLITFVLPFALALWPQADNALAEEAPPAAADFSPAASLIENAIREHAFPGCALAVGTSRGVLWLEAFGHLDYAGGPRATVDTMYDLASLSKVVGTTSVVLVLQKRGRLSPADTVARYLPEFKGDGREAVTIEHLLTHSSGLPAWCPIYRQAKSYKEVLDQILATPLEDAPATIERYSDLGFMLLGEAAARAGGKPLGELESDLVFTPLGLKDTMRNPPRELLERIAPTEVIEAEGIGAGSTKDGAGRAAGAPPAARNVAIRGVVHDENARAGGGITGHAGLFSTARDLSIFAAELLRGWRGESEIFPADILKRFAARRELVAGSSRALGWDTPSGQSSAGTLLGKRAFGHTGFTGTSLWLDPDRDLYILLLTNRVHPTRANQKIARVRRELADTAVLCLERKLRKL